MTTIIIVGLVMFGVGFYAGNILTARYMASLLIFNSLKNVNGHLHRHLYSAELVAKARKVLGK